MMADKQSAPSPLLLMLVMTFLILITSPTTFAAKDDPKVPQGTGKPYQAVDGFCNRRENRRDREFCIAVLKSDPRSAATKDLIGLLKISVDLAVENANRTQQFFTALSKNNIVVRNRALLRVLKDCSAAYGWCLKELRTIPRELLDDTAMASYDALMAGDALKTCKESLRKRKIANHSIWRRHQTATDYVRLCVEIARII